MSCRICKSKVERSVLKLECSSCNGVFHAKCVNLTANELDYIKKSKSIWRCPACTLQRRESLSHPSSNAARNCLSPTTSPSLPSVVIPCNPTSDTSTNIPTVNQLEFNSETVTLEMIYAKIISIEENQKKQIDVLIAKNEACEKRIHCLEERVNKLERQLNINSIEIFNVPNNSTALSNTDVALKVFRDGLNVNINERDIDKCYLKKIKLAKPPSNSNSAMSHLCKEEIMKAKREKGEQLTTNLINTQARSEKMFINECLTHQTRQLLKTTTAMKATKGYKYVWTRNGTVYLRKKEGDNCVKINYVADLAKI